MQLEVGGIDTQSETLGFGSRRIFTWATRMMTDPTLSTGYQLSHITEDSTMQSKFLF